MDVILVSFMLSKIKFISPPLKIKGQLSWWWQKSSGRATSPESQQIGKTTCYAYFRPGQLNEAEAIIITVGYLKLSDVQIEDFILFFWLFQYM